MSIHVPKFGRMLITGDLRRARTYINRNWAGDIIVVLYNVLRKMTFKYGCSIMRI